MADCGDVIYEPEKGPCFENGMMSTDRRDCLIWSVLQIELRLYIMDATF